MPKIDFIVISHNQYDHLDHRTVDMFGNSVMWYVPLGLKSWFEERGINSDKVIELDWWQSDQFTKDVNITFTPSVHWGTFQLAHEPFLEPPKLLAKAMELERLPQNQFGVLKIGETLIVKKIGAPKD